MSAARSDSSLSFLLLCIDATDEKTAPTKIVMTVAVAMTSSRENPSRDLVIRDPSCRSAFRGVWGMATTPVLTRSVKLAFLHMYHITSEGYLAPL